MESCRWQGGIRSSWQKCEARPRCSLDVGYRLAVGEDVLGIRIVLKVLHLHFTFSKVQHYLECDKHYSKANKLYSNIITTDRITPLGRKYISEVGWIGIARAATCRARGHAASSGMVFFNGLQYYDYKNIKIRHRSGTISSNGMFVSHRRRRIRGSVSGFLISIDCAVGVVGLSMSATSKPSYLVFFKSVRRSSTQTRTR